MTTHLISDPCYVLHTSDHKVWSEGFCETLFKAEKQEGFDGHFEYMGHKVFAHSTAHGDGTFEGSDGTTFGVDAGLIGAIPIALVDVDVDDLPDYVKAVDMSENDFGLISYYEGTFSFPHSKGELKIETSEEEYQCIMCGASVEHQYQELCWCCEEEEEEYEEEYDEGIL